MKILFLLLFFSAFQGRSQVNKITRIAYIADIHFHDIYGTYHNFKGLPVPRTGKMAKIRTMNAQLHSTRLFNENYFVLKAVLEDIAKKGIKIVALPGDYTDDGQPINLKGLAEILHFYKENHGISFFITTGNHDPVQPFGEPAGKKDFLGENGKNQPVFSNKGLYVSNAENEHPVIIERNLQKAGYQTILEYLGDFGFFPQQEYLYWSTPFSSYTPKTYSLKKALEASKLQNRNYRLNDTLQLPDVSYVVEPIEGLWLLAIDGNAYIPQQNGKFSGTGEGYNSAIDYKTHLFEWIKKISVSAERAGKTLIAFSHYPAIDFNEDASPELRKFLGENKWQLERVPEERIAENLARAGIKLHFAGHMHINDTGIRKYDDGKFLVNIQTPSLAAYIPGYKILHLKKNIAEIETVAIEKVPNFNNLFPLYEIEHNYLQKAGKPVWDKQILKSENYHDFTEAHLENLVKLRFVPNDWSSDFYDFFSGLSGKELLLLSKSISRLSPSELLANPAELSKTENQLSTELNLKHFNSWNGEKMILDFYKIRNADKLAFQDIPAARLQQYTEIIQNILMNPAFIHSEKENTQKLFQFMSIFNKFMNGFPSDHFQVDLKTGKISDLSAANQA